MQRMSEAHSSNLLQDLTLAHHEFSLTIINESGLIRRLLSEFQYVLEQAKNAWPSFKREPINFPRQLLADMIHYLKYSLARQHVFPAWLTALLLICFAVFSVVFLDRGQRAPSQILSLEELSDVAILDLSREDSGIGKGRVGFSRGRGEGLVPGPARSRGGAAVVTIISCHRR